MLRVIGTTSKKMGYLGRCKLCNHVVWHKYLSPFLSAMSKHDRVSHKNPLGYDRGFDSWVRIRLPEEVIEALDEASKNPKFWEAFRANPKRLLKLQYEIP